MLIGPEQQRDDLLKRLLTPDTSAFLFCFAPSILLRNAGKTGSSRKTAVRID